MSDQNPAEPSTVSPTGVAPVNRLKSYEGLWSAYNAALDDAKVNDVRFTSIRGIFDRRPPENPAYLREQGMEDMPNFNQGEFTAKVESYISTLVDHNTGGYRFASVKLKRKKENPPELSEYYDEKVTEFFNEAITEWDDDAETKSVAPYLLKSTVRDTQMGLFGIGLAHWKDDTDWRFDCLPTREFLVPQGVSITLDNCPAAFSRSEMTVTKIYDKVTKAGDDSGWNKKAVFQMLYERTSERRSGGAQETFAEWENRLRNNDVFIQSNFNPVLLVDCYVQEFTKEGQKEGISHYIIPRNASPTEVLFSKSRRYKNFGSFIRAFCDNPGPEGDWHGVKGFGDSIYDNCHFQNQFFNHMARTALIANMPMWQTGSEADRDKVSQLKWTNMGVMNPGITLEQVNLKTDLTGMLAIHASSQRMVNTNTRTYQPGESLGQQAKTATQSTFDRQDQAKLSTLQIKSYRMMGLDPMFSEMYWRLSRPNYPKVAPGGRAAVNFRKKCEDAGIPEDCYSKPIEVLADRTGGSGNQALDLMVAKELMAVASPGRGQLNARREIAKALKGSDRVEEFIQAEDVPQEQQGIIDIENSNLSDGQSFPARPYQEHLLHLGELSANGQGHLGVLVTAYQVASEMAKQGGIEQSLEDAKKLARVLEATLTHVAQHVEFLAQFQIKSYQELAKDFRKTLNDVAQFLETFQQQIGAAMEAQQPQGPQMSAKDQATMMSAQVEMEVKKAFAAQELELNRIKTLDKLQNMNERSAAKDQIKTAETLKTMQRKDAEFDQKLGQEATKTLTEREIALAQTRAQANAEAATQTE